MIIHAVDLGNKALFVAWPMLCRDFCGALLVEYALKADIWIVISSADKAGIRENVAWHGQRVKAVSALGDEAHRIPQNGFASFFRHRIDPKMGCPAILAGITGCGGDYCLSVDFDPYLTK